MERLRKNKEKSLKKNVQFKLTIYACATKRLISPFEIGRALGYQLGWKFEYYKIKKAGCDDAMLNVTFRASEARFAFELDIGVAR